MSGVALHVVGGLVEVADSGDMILARDADHVAGVRDDDGRVPHDVTRVALKDGRDDHHVVLSGQLKKMPFYWR